jgi:hypothetical protein
VLLFTLETIPAVAEFVFAFITAASEDVATATRESVFELTDAVPDVIAEPRDVDAVVMSDCKANDPLSSPAPVSVLVVCVQTSAAREPNELSVRVEYVQIAPGSVANKDDEAVATLVSVLEFTAEVPADIAFASELVAIATRESVFALTEEVIPAVAEFVLALITAANELDAVETVVPTVVTSDCKAKLPESKPAPVKVRVVCVHTSAARLPRELSVLEE